LPGSGEHRGAICALLQLWPNGAEDASVKTVGQDGFQSISDFDAIAVILDGKEQQDAFILALLSDAPFAKERVGEVFDGRVFELVDGYQGHLNAGNLLYAGTISFQLRTGLRVEHMRKVADVALGLERIGVEGKKRAGQQERRHEPTSETD